MQSPGITIEHEVPPRRSDRPVLNAILLRHPVWHFVLLFCWCFTVTALVRSVSIHVFHSGAAWNEIELYGFSVSLSGLTYFYTRRRWKTSQDAKN
jgi:hypothetical protein